MWRIFVIIFHSLHKIDALFLQIIIFILKMGIMVKCIIVKVMRIINKCSNVFQWITILQYKKLEHLGCDFVDLFFVLLDIYISTIFQRLKTSYMLCNCGREAIVYGNEPNKPHPRNALQLSQYLKLWNFCLCFVYDPTLFIKYLKNTLFSTLNVNKILVLGELH